MNAASTPQETALFRDFEAQALRFLLQFKLNLHTIDQVLHQSIPVGCEASSNGYCLIVRHVALSGMHEVCDVPLVIGDGQGVKVRFIAWLDNGELCLECFSPVAGAVNERFRDADVFVCVGSSV